MTFFANAGVKWPPLETGLRRAGAEALSGGAELWRLLSTIEGRDSDSSDASEDEEKIKVECARSLREAADLYSQSVDKMGPEMISGITLEELNTAAVDYPPFYFAPWPYPGPFDMRHLYEALISRIKYLASEIEGLDVTQDRRDMAFQVFRAMREWEMISSLARFIAVLNRRPAKS
jgi:hypothetical protein